MIKRVSGGGSGIDPSLLGSVVSYTSPSSPYKFKFPAITPPTVQFGGRPNRAKAAVANCSSFPSFKAPSNDSGSCCGLSSMGRRELILYMSAVPILVKDVGCVANAADLGASAISYMKEEIQKALSKGKAAGVLRLVFHDAGTFDINDKTGGMNGSIVLELGRPENKGLKKSVKILEKAKSLIDIIQPVSWADMIAVAGAEAVSLCGGPKIVVQLGRIDSTVPDPEGKLPEESLDVPALKQCFQNKGFSTQELVALSGAHTIGSKGFGDPFVFDNSYFKILLEKPWLSSAGMSAMVGLPSDRALVDDDECKRWIVKYADDQNLFFEDFKNAYVKLVNSGARWTNI
ncbi:hypothetical protein M9H77_13766 [Catharanthus roseus]|uniref:Uncharacterized protein n=1 Tax=Catharanthus roseus TaxID=4058 RepID=A0ACC0BL37_CATRO|nr:hypothetical protein M9H77_13766 [Catharanthus roseus]